MDSSPVTVADFSVQAIVLGVLEQYFPDHDFIAEETSSVLREDPPSLEAVRDVVSKTLGRVLTEGELCAAIDLGAKGFGGKQQGRQRRRRGKTWVLDPIDGTKGFLRGEQFCVALVRDARDGAVLSRVASMGKVVVGKRALFHLHPSGGCCHFFYVTIPRTAAA